MQLLLQLNAKKKISATLNESYRNAASHLPMLCLILLGTLGKI